MPNTVTNIIENTEKDKSRPVYDKDYVRTDSTEQKITKFFRTPASINTSIEIVNNDVSITEEEETKPTEETMLRHDAFEQKVMDKTMEQKYSAGSSISGGSVSNFATTSR